MRYLLAIICLLIVLDPIQASGQDADGLTLTNHQNSSQQMGTMRFEGNSYSVVILKNVNQRNESFNATAAKNDVQAKVTSCSLLVNIPIGTGHGNDSYGGLCIMTDGETDSNVLVCDDEMVGHFGIEDATPDTTKEQLIKFVIQNCYGG